MKSKTLAMTNGILGLIGGIILLFGIWFITAGAAADLSAGGDATTGTGATTLFLTVLKIVILAFGIWGAVHFKGKDEVTTAPSVLLIVGGAISLIPFLGWVGGIISIIGGSLYLSKLKNFKQVSEI